MTNKEIQEKRMREYFIQATKDLLKGEGLRSVSVRSVADRAGYSFATMYNYFRDINELLFLCVSDFQEECNSFVTERVSKLKPGDNRLKLSVVAYMEYFSEYPGIFELFFMAKGIELGNKPATLSIINNSLTAACRADIDHCVANRMWTKKEIGEKMRILQAFCTGSLLHYINRLSPSSYAEFISNARMDIEVVFAS